MELKQNNTYIFEWQRAFDFPPFKGRVEEMTETSVIIENLDTDQIKRYGKKDFNSNWKAVELVEDFYEKFKEAIKEMYKQPVEFIKTCEKRCYRTQIGTGDMKVYVVESDFKSYEDNFKRIEGIFIRKQDAEIKKKEIENNYLNPPLPLEGYTRGELEDLYYREDSNLSEEDHVKLENWYYVLHYSEFNFCEIEEYELQ